MRCTHLDNDFPDVWTLLANFGPLLGVIGKNTAGASQTSCKHLGMNYWSINCCDVKVLRADAACRTFYFRSRYDRTAVVKSQGCLEEGTPTTFVHQTIWDGCVRAALNSISRYL